MLCRDGCMYSSDASNDERGLVRLPRLIFLGFFNGELIKVKFGAGAGVLFLTYMYYVFDTPR